MSFLVEGMQARTSKSNIITFTESVDDNCQTSDKWEIRRNDFQENSNKTADIQPCNETIYDDENTTNDATETPTNAYVSRPTQRSVNGQISQKKRKQSQSEDIMEKAMKLLSESDKDDAPEDACDLFGRSVAHKLRELSELDRSQAEIDINIMLHNYRFRQTYNGLNPYPSEQNSDHSEQLYHHNSAKLSAPLQPQIVSPPRPAVCPIYRDIEQSAQQSQFVPLSMQAVGPVYHAMETVNSGMFSSFSSAYTSLANCVDFQ